MKPIQSADRLVANVNDATFEPWINADGSDSGTAILQLNSDLPTGTGFHIYRMAPGTSSEAHEHTEHEEFFIIQGSLRDNDGTLYTQGDLVLLKKGTQHYSTTDDGCLLAVYIPTAEISL